MKEKYIDIVFDGPPGPESGRFVEAENQDRFSMSLGEWVERDDGFWAIRVPVEVQLLPFDCTEHTGIGECQKPMVVMEVPEGFSRMADGTIMGRSTVVSTDPDRCQCVHCHVVRHMSDCAFHGTDIGSPGKPEISYEGPCDCGAE